MRCIDERGQDRRDWERSEWDQDGYIGKQHLSTNDKKQTRNRWTDGQDEERY